MMMAKPKYDPLASAKIAPESLEDSLPASASSDGTIEVEVEEPVIAKKAAPRAPVKDVRVLKAATITWGNTGQLLKLVPGQIIGEGSHGKGVIDLLRAAEVEIEEV